MASFMSWDLKINPGSQLNRLNIDYTENDSYESKHVKINDVYKYGDWRGRFMKIIGRASEIRYQETDKAGKVKNKIAYISNNSFAKHSIDAWLNPINLLNRTGVDKINKKDRKLMTDVIIKHFKKNKRGILTTDKIATLIAILSGLIPFSAWSSIEKQLKAMLNDWLKSGTAYKLGHPSSGKVENLTPQQKQLMIKQMFNVIKSEVAKGKSVEASLQDIKNRIHAFLPVIAVGTPFDHKAAFRNIGI